MDVVCSAYAPDNPVVSDVLSKVPKGGHSPSPAGLNVEVLETLPTDGRSSGLLLS